MDRVLHTEYDEASQRGKKKKYIIIFLVVLPCVILLLLGVLMIIYWHKTKTPELKIYLKEDFTEGLMSYESADAFWVRKESEEDGYIKLSRLKYFTPYLSVPFQLSEAPEGSFVCQMAVKVNRFTDEAVVLASFFFPTWEMAVVVNDEGKIGLAQNLFQRPHYSAKFFGEIDRGKWQELLVHLNLENGLINVLLEGRKVISLPLQGDTYPLQEIRLGATWLKGGGNYGSPLDIEYDSFQLATEGLLPRTTMFDFYLNLFAK